MTTRFRVVDHAATGQRFRTVSPASHQYMSAAQAALRSQLTGEQSNPSKSNFSPMPMTPTPGGGSDGASAVAAMAGLPGRPSAFGTHKNRYGFDVSNMLDNPAAAYTELGAALQQSEGGRQVAAMIGAQYPGPGSMSQLDPFAVGGRLYGRGTALQRVSGGKHWYSTALALAGSYADFQAGLAKAEAAGALGSVVGLATKRYVSPAVADDPAVFAAAFSFGASVGAGHYLRGYIDTHRKGAKGTKGGTKEFDPWSGNLYGRRADGGASGDMPTTTPEQSGGHAMSTALLLDTLAEALRRRQEQAHLPAGSDAGGGGGTSTAPERLFLHGMKHWYDMVAMHRVG